MGHIPIRGYTADGRHEQRLFDYVIRDDGTEALEQKDGKVVKTISISDLNSQLENARNTFKK
jgi:glutamine cyclotransferase